MIFLTGHADVPTAVDMVKRGAFDFCEKPFSDNALVDRIEQALQRSARVLARGGSGPFSHWEGLITRSARSFPDQRPFLESLSQFFRAEPEPCLGGTARSALAPEHLEALHKIIGEFTPLCSRR